MPLFVPLHAVALEGVLSRAGGRCGGGVGCSSLHSFVGHHSRGKLLLRLLKAGAGGAVQPVHLQGKSTEEMQPTLPFSEQTHGKGSNTKQRSHEVGKCDLFVCLRDTDMRTWSFVTQTFEFFIFLLHTISLWGIPVMICKVRGGLIVFTKMCDVYLLNFSLQQYLETF